MGAVGPASGTRRWFGSPPGRLWTSLAVADSFALLWIFSHPGFRFVPMLVTAPVTLGLAVAWGVRFAAWALAEPRRPDRRWWIGPVIATIAVTLLMVEAPLRLRFEVARSDFEAVTAGLEPQGGVGEWEPLEVPDRLGSYQIVSAYQVGIGVIFYEEQGAGFHDAGFAYLPSGPDPELASGSFESPVFQSLGGGWYAWQASW